MRIRPMKYPRFKSIQRVGNVIDAYDWNDGTISEYQLLERGYRGNNTQIWLAIHTQSGAIVPLREWNRDAAMSKITFFTIPTEWYR